jgi:hypothetical protein
MSNITVIDGEDSISTSRTVINTNFGNLNADKMETSVLDTDTALTANSDAKVATQKAVKAYVDAGGNVNASTTNKGIVEEATQAEVDAGTAVGGTGARLFVNPSTLNRVRKLATNTSVTEIGNLTNSEIDIFSQSIAANLLSTNNAIRFKVLVSNYTVDSDTASDPVFRLKYGGTTVVTITLQQGGDTNAHQGYIEGYLFADGSTTAQRGTVHIFFQEESLNSDNNDASVDYINTVATGTAAENSATALTLALTVQFGTSGINNDLVPAGAIIELIS